MKKLNDFGEKIGGAKKDIWALFHELPEEKQNEMARKDKVWPRPRYESLNVDRSVLYWRNEMRKAVVSHPQANPSDYVNFCANFRKAVEKCCSMDDIAAFYKEDIYPFMKRVDEADEKKWKYASKTTKPFFNGKAVLKYANHQELIPSDCNSSNFMTSKEEKEAKKYDILEVKADNLESKPYKNSMFANKVRTLNCIHIFYDKQNFSDMLEGNDSLFIPMYDKARLGVFSSKELANKAIDKHKTMIASKKSGKSKFLPPHLSRIERTGSNYDFFRISDGNILLTRYGLRGGEFGNYTTSKDRMGSINMAYDAFYDLHHAIGISAKDISLGGELAIAFGARGHGNALAHFEPDKNVINITKMRGAGSLAHEWGHAMDWYIGNKLGLYEFMSDSLDNKNVPDAAKALIKSMMYADNGAETDFYKASKKFDDNYVKTGNGYWASGHEMFARAFACYVLDKLNGKKSDYLVGHAECATNGIDIAYPVGRERDIINEKFDAFFEEMIEKGFFTKNTTAADIEKSDENIVEIELELFESQDGQLKFFC